MGTIALITIIALFFIFDSITLRIQRSKDEETICDLTVDLDNALEMLAQSEEETTRHYNNYQCMAYKKRKFENFLINFKEGDGEKIDEFLKWEMTINKYNKLKWIK